MKWLNKISKNKIGKKMDLVVIQKGPLRKWHMNSVLYKMCIKCYYEYKIFDNYKYFTCKDNKPIHLSEKWWEQKIYL